MGGDLYLLSFGRSREFVHLHYLPLLAPSLKISTQNLQLFWFFFFPSPPPHPPIPRRLEVILPHESKSWAMMCKGVFNQANWKLTAMIPTVNLMISSILSRKGFCLSTGRTVFSISLVLCIEIPVIEIKMIILCFSWKLDTYFSNTYWQFGKDYILKYWTYLFSLACMYPSKQQVPVLIQSVGLYWSDWYNHS